MVAMLFGSIMIIGTLGFSYYSKIDVQEADLYNTSVEIAELILNDWKASGGESSYNPVESLSGQLDISNSDTSLTGLENILGSYLVVLDGNPFLLTLSQRITDKDKPKLINVVVDWIERPQGRELEDPRRFIKLSGYVANNQ